jgi:peptide subunit release factor 1 (eRF1)
VLGIKDTGYTGEYGLEELVNRSEDLIKETALAKERELMKRFFAEISKEGLAVYGEEKVKAALNAGAVEIVLISEEYPSSKVEDLLRLAEQLGTNTAFISVDTSEGKEFFRLGGVGALLRFKFE